MGHEKARGRGTAPAMLGALALVLCLLTPPAQATYEQVGAFAGSATPVAEEKFTEEVQLGGIGGMAVNYTGAGGVEPGTVYAVTFISLNARVAMFEPTAGGLKFVEGWVVTETEGPYEVCGPPGELPNGDTDPHPNCPLQVKGSPGQLDIDVDQSTGNVYVLSFANPIPKVVVAYTPDGGEEITRFGEMAPSGETVAASPGKVHSSPYPGGLAVNGDGEVYVYDQTTLVSAYHRLMVFRPKTPGDYSEYEYAGEVAAGALGEGELPTRPVTDAAGNVYVAGDDYVEMYEPEVPQAYPGKPAKVACSFSFEKGGITALTVHPLTGEPFFGNYKKEETKKWVRSLGPCNPGTGKFEGPKGEEITARFEVSPERGDLWGLALDPERELPGRPPGVLYAGAPHPVPSIGKGEPGQSSLGYLFAQSESQESPPAIEAQSVSHVTQTTAQLRAQIDPAGFDTSYRFQYLSEAAYEANPPEERFAGADEAPQGGALLGGGKATLSALASISGLEPDTAYRYRALAESHCAPAEPERLCQVPGEARAFRTFPPQDPGLPDDRAWELVSPAQKQGGQVLPADPRISSCANVQCKPGATYQHFPMQSAPNGNAVAYEGTAFGTGGALAENQYVSRRTDTGWETVNPTPPLLLGASQSGYRSLSANLEDAVIGQPSPSLSPKAPPGYENLYAQPVAEPLELEPFVKQAPPNRPPEGAGGFEIRYAGASTDGSRIFFRANDALTEETPLAPAAEDGGAAKYNLYEWSDGQLSLVNVKPGNAEAPAGAAFGGGPAVNGNAISADGTTVFWSDDAGQVYARIDGTETLEIEAPGKYLSASTDGSLVLLQNGCLYAMATEECTDLTGGQGGFEGIVGQSDDLSHVYFVDTAVLSGEEENSEGDKAQAGKFNLYAWSEGTIRFVATLLAVDNAGSGGGGKVGIGDWESAPASRTAEASPNGRFVAFLSQAQLTGYENAGPCEEESGTGTFRQTPCPEAFVYDSVSGELSCASCNPSGTRPLGWNALRLILGPSYLPQPRYLTDSGRLFFDSQDALVPADTNEGAEDVYEWEPEGVGSCERESGCIFLLSGGREDTDSNFLAADPSGANVFFTTRERLSPKDKDELIDLYVAREGGGIAAESETTKPECQGEACQPPAFALDDPLPSSWGFQGAGNAQEKTSSAARKPCAKGKVKRRGRCVPRHRHHRRAAHRNGRKSR